MQRQALSMLEVMTGTLVMALIGVAVVESMKASTEYAVLTERQDDMAIGGQAILDDIVDDISRSGWEFPSFVREDYGDATGARTAAADRQRLYYPYVVQQSPHYRASSGGFNAEPHLDEGLPDAIPHSSADQTLPSASVFNFRHFRRDGSLVALDLPDGLPGEPDHATTRFRSQGVIAEGYDRSFYARSQELVFLVSANSAWNEDPEEQEFDLLDFSGASANWQTPTTSAVDSYYQTRYAHYVDTVGMPADQAADQAHEDVRVTMFSHDEIEVLRMNEFQLNIQRDATGDMVLGNGKELQLKPHYRPGAPDGKRYIDNIVVPGAWISVDVNNEVNVKIRWETNVAEDAVSVTEDISSPTERLALTQLREYIYAVVPSATGVGRLVRAYSIIMAEGQGTPTIPSFPTYGDIISYDTSTRRAFVVDDVLSDDVCRIVFDTFRSVDDGSLGINEVRVRLYMAITSQSASQAIVYRMFETAFTMRTGNNERTVQEVGDVLRDGGVAFPY